MLDVRYTESWQLAVMHVCPREASQSEASRAGSPGSLLGPPHHVEGDVPLATGHRAKGDEQRLPWSRSPACMHTFEIMTGGDKHDTQPAVQLV